MAGESSLAVVICSYCDATSKEALSDRSDLVAVEPKDLDTIPDMNPTVIFVYHTVSLTGEFLTRCKSLKLVVRMGVGYDNIDVNAAGNLGIAVSNARYYGTEEVADSAMSHILNLYRQTLKLEAWTHQDTPLTNAPQTVEVARGAVRIRGQKLGLVGLGCIGDAVYQRAKAFGFEVSFFDPYVDKGREDDLTICRHESFEDLLKNSDIISFHCNLTDENHHMLNAKTIALMKAGSRVVNVSRGGLIDEQALAAALRSGQIGSAALDVHEVEPYVRRESPFYQVPNVYCLPHVAWYSEQSFADIWRIAVDEAKRALSPGATYHKLENCVNLFVFKENPEKWH